MKINDFGAFDIAANCSQTGQNSYYIPVNQFCRDIVRMGNNCASSVPPHTWNLLFENSGITTATKTLMSGSVKVLV